MLAMSHDGYTALIKPERLVDVLTDSHMTLGIAAGPGRLIAMSGKGDPRLLRILTAGAAAESMNAMSSRRCASRH
ncbi:hypothetical protein ACFSTI_09750 [Rhizorhabdus histidinilytica]